MRARAHSLTHSRFEQLAAVTLRLTSAMQHLRHCKSFAHVSFPVAPRQLTSRVPAVSVRSGYLALHSGRSNQDQQYSRFRGLRFRYAITGLVAGTGAVLAYGLHHNKAEQATIPVTRTNSLPVYSQEEVIITMIAPLTL
ncbi:hypothetical protein AMELA_G00008360 [Ameiurus melas]|uniref:Uncharacterized protein n=1 Tax=Ameiurus melas TaxID=219545 RepID=A0A7J6BHC4_AMEME|nr:hypothetical protein AMELA_G00008360 [Ameiurus melas]